MRHLIAVGLKWLSVWVVLLVFGFAFGPTPEKGAVMALFLAIISWWADLLLPFRVQGITRWALDGGLATVVLYAVQFLWPGPGITFYNAVFAGAVIGGVEIPLHFLIATWLGGEKPPEDSDGIPDVRR